MERGLEEGEEEDRRSGREEELSPWNHRSELPDEVGAALPIFRLEESANDHDLSTCQTGLQRLPCVSPCSLHWGHQSCAQSESPCRNAPRL